jgi:flagellar biosynthesis/type III secretory pathway chaperone
MNMMRRDLPTQAKSAIAAPAARALTMPQRPSALPSRGASAAPPQHAAAGVPGVRPSAKGEDLFQVIRQLSDLLLKENAALKRHKADEVKAMTERKEQLARLYQSHMNAVHRDPGLLKVLEPAKRDAMAQSAMRLGDLMQENASLLKANIQSINMFFKAVTDALKSRQEEKSAAYSRRGSLNGYTVTKRSLAVSFNQTM